MISFPRYDSIRRRRGWLFGALRAKYLEIKGKMLVIISGIIFAV